MKLEKKTPVAPASDPGNLDEARAEIARLKRKIAGLERDMRMLSVTYDNSERLRKYNEAEKNLQYMYNDLLLKNCPNMIFLWDETLRLVLCTHNCGASLGVPEINDLKGQPLAKIFAAAMGAEWVNKFERQCRECISKLTSVQYNDEIVLLGGGHVHMQATISPIIDDSGVSKGAVMSVTDTTELALMRDKAEEAARSKSAFLANMSHEIRTPMNAIKGLSELLFMTSLTRLQRDYVRNIVSSSNSLLHIINDVLDFSKIDANKMEILNSEYKLAELLGEVTSVIRVRAADKDLELFVVADPNLPRVLRGDDVRIKQVLFNILSNAVKYTEKGHVRLSLRAEPRDGGLALCFEVADTGLGIKEEDLPRLFDAFSRVDLLTNRSILGTGLGLAISKRLVQAMGGEISLRSEYGKGSVFSFYVPQEVVDDRPMAAVERPEGKQVLLLDKGERARGNADMLLALGVGFAERGDEAALRNLALQDFTHCIYYPDVAEDFLEHYREDFQPSCVFISVRDMRQAMQQSNSGDIVLFEPLLVTGLAEALNRASGQKEEADLYAETSSASLKLENVTALVVDDNAINLVVAEELLRVYGANVVTAPGGQEALTLAADTRYDIIFMDHMMPGMDGIETATRIRRGDTANRYTPIIALTANVVDNMRRQYLKNGMDDMISKPIELTELNRVLLTWLPLDKIQRKSAAEGDQPVQDAGCGEETGSWGDELDLISLLDNFGMYASEVMSEINGNLEQFTDRLEMAASSLGGLVRSLVQLDKVEAWSDFALRITDLSELLHGIGARDCAARCRNLEVAAREGNSAYIHPEFKSLMGNMYMLEKKLAVLVPFIREGRKPDAPFNDYQFLRGRLLDMRKSLHARNYADALAVLEMMSSLSYDKELDGYLKTIKTALEEGDLDAALQANTEAVQAYSRDLDKQPELLH